MANDLIPFYGGAKSITMLAGTGGLAGKQFVTNAGALAVGLGTDGGVPTGVIPAAAGVSVVGVADQDTAAGLSVGVFIEGVVPVVAGAALTAGTKVMTDTAGKAIAWTSTNQVAGTCMADTASGADAMIRIAS